MNHLIMFLDRVNKAKLVPPSYERKTSFNLKNVIVINNRFNLSIMKELTNRSY